MIAIVILHWVLISHFLHVCQNDIANLVHLLYSLRINSSHQSPRKNYICIWTTPSKSRRVDDPEILGVGPCFHLIMVKIRNSLKATNYIVIMHQVHAQSIENRGVSRCQLCVTSGFGGCQKENLWYQRDHKVGIMTSPLLPWNRQKYFDHSTGWNRIQTPNLMVLFYHHHSCVQHNWHIHQHVRHI